MFIRVNSGAISGIDAVEVTAEINVASGGIGLFIVGLPDNTIKESHERIQAAFENSGFKLFAKNSSAVFIKSSSVKTEAASPVKSTLKYSLSLGLETSSIILTRRNSR